VVILQERKVFDLYLLLVSGRDVGNGPTGLFADGLLGRGEQVVETGKRRAVEHHLRLRVVPRHNVAHGSQRGRNHVVLIVPEIHNSTVTTNRNHKQQRKNVTNGMILECSRNICAFSVPSDRELLVIFSGRTRI